MIKITSNVKTTLLTPDALSVKVSVSFLVCSEKLLKDVGVGLSEREIKQGLQSIVEFFLFCVLRKLNQS